MYLDNFIDIFLRNLKGLLFGRTFKSKNVCSEMIYQTSFVQFEYYDWINIDSPYCSVFTLCLGANRFSISIKTDF